MRTARWILTLTTLSLGALAVIDVGQAPAVAAVHQPTILVRSEPALPRVPGDEQAEASAGGPLELPKTGVCPSDMVEVNGDYCPAPEQICDDYISEKRDRCVRYRSTVRCIGKPNPMHFCVDRYEYPNEAGQRPIVAVTWDEARDICVNEGKRLCEAEEWTLACEGPERKPYPFGFVRDATACNIDKPYVPPDNTAYYDTTRRMEEVRRISQSEPSGSREHCVSDYGVYDMVGNVDEWVDNPHGSPEGPEFQSGLKGGYWGPVRNRCRPMTTDHNHWHHGYQIGFRCCKDAAEINRSRRSSDVENTAGFDSDDGAYDRPEAVQPSMS